MNDTTRPNFQGWYCVIEDHHSKITPWLDVQFFKEINPNELKGIDLETVTREVCWKLKRRYTKKVSLSWEKRMGGCPRYELTFLGGLQFTHTTFRLEN